MTIRAERDPRFYFRFLLIGLGALAFGLYCVYDGAIGYPGKQERALAYQKFVLDEKNEGKWNDYAAKHGWSNEYPGEPKDAEKHHVDVEMQFWMAGACGLLALLPAVERVAFARAVDRAEQVGAYVELGTERDARPSGFARQVEVALEGNRRAEIQRRHAAPEIRHRRLQIQARVDGQNPRGAGTANRPR